MFPINELLTLLEVVLTLGAVILANKLFGRYGLLAWMPVAIILANLTTVKAVGLFGIDTTLGTIMFASTFFATDMMVELYGKDEAKKAVWMGIGGACVFVVCMQIALLYVPLDYDSAHPAMEVLFGLNIRVTVASIACCLLANLVDVHLYDFIRNKTGVDKWLGFRTSFAAIICNCIENFIFMFLAFTGVFDPMSIVVIALSTSIVEFLVGLCNAPFMYVAKAITAGFTDKSALVK